MGYFCGRCEAHHSKFYGCPLDKGADVFGNEYDRREVDFGKPDDPGGINPKDAIGVKKPQLGLFPAAGKIMGALAMQDGAVKYGPYNWRDKAVKYTIYLDAVERHLLALRDGENVASDSGVHHLGHIIACAAILADAMSVGKLVDDRPAGGCAAELLALHTKK